MKVVIVTIGDEILIGQVVDTNSAWIGKELAAIGVTVQEVRSIKDDVSSITDALTFGIAEADLVLLTGGLGPTKDDITKKAIADYMGVGMSFHQETYDRIVALFAKFGRTIQDSHLHQCDMPDNAKILTNRMGTAPGMQFEFKGTTIVSMPGVPYEMKAIMNDYIFPMVKSQLPEDNHVYSRTIMTAGEGESRIETAIGDILDLFPDGVSIAYLPSLSTVRIRITGHGERAAIQPIVDQFTKQISERINHLVYGYDGITISQALQNLFKAKGLMVGTIESCTGGYLSHRITTDSGSSAYYAGSAITYTNALKQKLLGVGPDTLKNHGAVSEETVIEMAKGGLSLLGSDITISISGIAGPTGGTEHKPVGTIWMCIADQYRHHSFKINASKDRAKNIEYAGNVALNALRKFVLKWY